MHLLQRLPRVRLHYDELILHVVVNPESLYILGPYSYFFLCRILQIFKILSKVLILSISSDEVRKYLADWESVRTWPDNANEVVALLTSTNPHVEDVREDIVLRESPISLSPRIFRSLYEYEGLKRWWTAKILQMMKVQTAIDTDR